MALISALWLAGACAEAEQPQSAALVTNSAMSTDDTPDQVYQKMGVSALGIASDGTLRYRDWVLIIKAWQSSSSAPNCFTPASDSGVHDCVYLYADSESPALRVMGSASGGVGILDGGADQNPLDAVIELMQRDGNSVVMWNDQSPCGSHQSPTDPKNCQNLEGSHPYPSSSEHGWEVAHSKGYLGIGPKGGVYVNHSNPHFPVTDDSSSAGTMSLGGPLDHTGLSSDYS